MNTQPRTVDRFDLDAIMNGIRQARRRDNIDTVLDWCECARGAFDLRDEDVSALDPVRDAMVWALRALDMRVCTSCGGSGDREIQGKHVWVVHGGCDDCGGTGHQSSRRQATRVANIARTLPNPQPVVTAISEAKGHRAGTTREHVLPAPTHALSLYVRALQLAKGTEWFGWFAKATKQSMLPWATEWNIPPSISTENARIYRDGTIACGTACPELPRVQ